MAEVADIMTAPHQKAILPDLAAGCSMADMANLAKVERCWRELNQVLNAEEQITPVTYINSAADLKAFCGEHGGIVCTSSNAGTIAKWAFERRRKCCSSPTSTWAAGPAQHGHPDGRNGRLGPRPRTRRPDTGADQESKDPALEGPLLGAPDVPEIHIDAFRAKHPDGLVISHPECNFEVCRLRLRRLDRVHRQDHQGSAGRHALAGGHRAQPGRPPGQEVKPQDKIVQFMATTICMCSTMQRIDPQHLAWTLENLAEGKVVNQILVPEHEAVLAKLALERMLDIS
jgi:quinolinate synthase